METLEYMERFELGNDTEGDPHYSLSKKFPSGQTAEIGYYVDCEDKDWSKLILSVTFVIYHKRKKKFLEDPSETTGKDGLAPAIWAYKALEFEQEALLNEWTVSQVRTLVFWSDSRRRKVYEKFLGRYGYYITRDSGSLCLEKLQKARN